MGIIPPFIFASLSKPTIPNKKLIGRFVETIIEELNIDIRSLGSLTCKREDLARGFEPERKINLR